MPGPLFVTPDLAYLAKLNQLSNGMFTVSPQTVGFTAAPGFWYVMKNDAVTVVLPLAPAAGDRIRFSAATSGVKTVTLSRNGQPINSAAADLTLGYDFELVYVDGVIGWRVSTWTAQPPSSPRNLVINPNYDIAQRGLTYALTTSVAYGSADRHGFKMAGTAAGIANVVDAQAQGFVGFKNCLKLGRTAGSAQVGVISGQTCWETLDCVRFQGKTAALSVYVKAGANFSGANLAVKLISGKGTDQTLVSMEAGTWTTQANQLNVNQVITAGVQRYTIGSVTLPNDITQLGIQYAYTPTGVAGADDNVYITGWDLSEGSVAPPIEFRHQHIEQEMCRRYFRRIVSDAGNNGMVDAGFAYLTTNAYMPLIKAQFMRVLPTLSVSALADIAIFNGGNITPTSLSMGGTPSGPQVIAGCAGGLTIGDGALLQVLAGTGKFLDLSAEL